MQIEKRQMGELRTDESGGKLIGYAAVFNKRSNDLGGFVEEIQPGAFKQELASGADVRALWNHDSNIVLGRTASGTLDVSEDDHGLKIEITPPDTQTARDLLESVKRGDVSQMSFSFSVKEGGQVWSESDDGIMLRTLTNLNIYEVSPVTFPAYPDTSVAMRSLDAFKQENSGDEKRNNSAKRARMLLGLHKRGLRK